MTTYSIIIPSYQGVTRVKRLVQFICNSAETLGIQEDLEIIVVIDGSTDGTYDHLSAFQSTVHLRVIRQPNAGLAQSRNRGISAATVSLIWYLDDDMEIDSTCMTQHLLRPRQHNAIRMGSHETCVSRLGARYAGMANACAVQRITRQSKIC